MKGDQKRDSGARETKHVPSALLKPVSVRYSPYYRQLSSSVRRLRTLVIVDPGVVLFKRERVESINDSLA